MLHGHASVGSNVCVCTLELSHFFCIRINHAMRGAKAAGTGKNKKCYEPHAASEAMSHKREKKRAKRKHKKEEKRQMKNRREKVRSVRNGHRGESKEGKRVRQSMSRF